MPSSLNSSMGKAIVDTNGKVRIGKNHDGLDLLALGEQIKEVTMKGVQKQVDGIEKNKAVVMPAICALQIQMDSLKADAMALSNYLGALPGITNSFKDIDATVIKSGEYSQNSYIRCRVSKPA